MLLRSKLASTIRELLPRSPTSNQSCSYLAWIYSSLFCCPVTSFSIGHFFLRQFRWQGLPLDCPSRISAKWAFNRILGHPGSSPRGPNPNKAYLRLTSGLGIVKKHLDTSSNLLTLNPFAQTLLSILVIDHLPSCPLSVFYFSIDFLLPVYVSL